MDCEFAVSVHLFSPFEICPWYLLPKAWEDMRIKINNGFSVPRILWKYSGEYDRQIFAFMKLLFCEDGSASTLHFIECYTNVILLLFFCNSYQNSSFVTQFKCWASNAISDSPRKTEITEIPSLLS